MRAVLGLWCGRGGADLQYCKRNDRRRALRIRETMMEKTKTVDRMTAALEQGLLRPALSLAAACDPAATRRFLKLLRVPEAGCTELRVLRAALDRQGNIHCAENFGLNRTRS